MLLPPHEFRGRACVVTGGTSGIGRHVAMCLAGLGADVAVLGRDPDRIDSTVAEATQKGLRIHGYSVDVRDRDALEDALGDAGERLGTVQHLVNAAAGNFRVAPEDLSPRGWEAVTRIVLDGTWHSTQIVARRLLELDLGGSVVSIGSSKAHHGGPDTAASAAAKAGVVALTKSLAMAWGPRGIRLNLVTPGVTTGTGAVGALFAHPRDLEDDLRRVPLGRHTTLDEVADAVTFLLSDRASAVTGAELVLDGGRSLGID